MDLCMSGITCQKVGKIYRQRSIMKRPGLVNEVSMFVGYGSFSTSSHLFSLLLHRCPCLLGSLEVRGFHEPQDSKFTSRFLKLFTHLSQDLSVITFIQMLNLLNIVILLLLILSTLFVRHTFHGFMSFKKDPFLCVLLPSLMCPFVKLLAPLYCGGSCLFVFFFLFKNHNYKSKRVRNGLNSALSALT